MTLCAALGIRWGERAGIIYFLKPGYTNVCLDFSSVSPEAVSGREARPLGAWARERPCATTTC